MDPVCLAMRKADPDRGHPPGMLPGLKTTTVRCSPFFSSVQLRNQLPKGKTQSPCIVSLVQLHLNPRVSQLTHCRHWGREGLWPLACRGTAHQVPPRFPAATAPLVAHRPMQSRFLPATRGAARARYRQSRASRVTMCCLPPSQYTAACVGSQGRGPGPKWCPLKHQRVSPSNPNGSFILTGGCPGRIFSFAR